MELFPDIEHANPSNMNIHPGSQVDHQKNSPLDFVLPNKAVIFFAEKTNQLMMNCWFGLVVWRFPFMKGIGISLGVTRFESQTTGPTNIYITTS